MERIVALVQKETISHYRVSIYNYLKKKFVEHGLRFVVIGESRERDNPHGICFDWIRMKIRSLGLLRQLETLKPSVVIGFLSLKHPVIWTLLVYDIVRRCPVLNWGHAIDLSRPKHFVTNWLYSLINVLSAGIILYSEDEKRFLSKRNMHKEFVASNTLNFGTLKRVVS